MQTFLDEVAAHIFSNYSSDLGRIAVVLPNRRAGLFLKKNLAKLAGKTIWAPSIFSVEDFITELSGYNIIDPVFLQLELYEVHRKVEGASAQGFEEFLKWGGVLLADFNEVDMYLADHRDLFNYLTDAKAIALWNPEHTKLTDFEIRYLRFYQSLDSYYKELRNRLEFKKQVYQGLAYRIVSEKLDKLLETLPWVKIIFAGFNALTAAEEKIMMYLQNAGRADVIWDSDEYYLNDPMQEAGTFLRQNLKTIKPIEFNATINNFESKEKQITVLGVPKNIGQVKITGQLLDALLASNKNAGSIAIVLNNERLMVPLLNSIPDSVQEFNLTMGLSLKDTPLFRLIDAAFNLQQNILNFSKGNPGNLRIYHRDILRLLEHPYIRLMFEHVEPNIQAVIDEIKNSNRVFFKPENLLKDYFQQTKDEINTLHCLFNPWNNNASNAIQSLVNVLKDLKIFFIKRNADAGNLLPELLLEIEYVFHFSRVFNQLKEVITAYPFVKNLCELYELFTQIVRSAKIPFYGEPLKGLQIMGMLETRVLDFENIIMLSVNEDLIPAGKHTNSFIPFEIKRIFKLPTYQDRNAVFAYHFYRLLQRSEQVYILYNTESDQLGGGEKSRFISQILHELPVYNANIRISEEKLEVNVTESIEEEPIEIVKNPEILTKLEKLGNRGFSASAINTYRNCSLQFYFKYIAGLSELEDLEETIESSTLGTVIHDVLRRKYYPLVGKVLSKELILENLTEIKKLVSESFQKHYSGGEIGHGKNLLIYEVACQLIENYIRFEANFAEERIKDEKITIKELEAEFSTGFEFISNGKSRSVIIKGIIDRIDTLGNEIRIIDYKTGLVLNRDVKFRDWSELKSESKLDKCYQLLHYAYILHNSGKYQTQTIQSGIISLRNLSTGFMTLELPGKLPLQEDTFIEFENILTGIIGELFDSNFSFSQTTVKENCIYCPFRTICNR